MRLNELMSVKSLLLTGAITSLVLVGCGDPKTEQPAQNEDPIETKKEELDPNGKQSRLAKIGKKVFSIPSPLQLSLLIKETGAEYDQSLLHDVQKVESYLDEVKMALNMGVYGADLGYVSVYENNSDAIGYMKTVNMLSEKLEIAEAFDQKLITKISDHIEAGAKDSLLITISDAYRDADEYLKDNKREYVGALILAGGWVESIHFATLVNEVENNKTVRSRIGEQKKALDNILNILVRYYSKPGVGQVYDSLEQLWDIFDQVQITYTYEKPEVDVENRHTTIKSKTNVEFTPETFKAISNKVNEIRNLITK